MVSLTLETSSDFVMLNNSINKPLKLCRRHNSARLNPNSKIGLIAN